MIHYVNKDLKSHANCISKYTKRQSLLFYKNTIRLIIDRVLASPKYLYMNETNYNNSKLFYFFKK